MLGVCYYPEQWPESLWADDARRMADLGISFVRIGEFAWSRIEPRPECYDWEWLDRVFQTLSQAGLKIVLGTPTATPPKWLVDKHPEILPLDAKGYVRRFGSRRHYCFSSPVYRAYARQIIEALAIRYGGHSSLIAWQTDNEYGCHNTARSYSPAAAAAFRTWLQCRYPSIESLNEAWGNAFWSMCYGSFSEIDPPMQAVTETNPAHRLDWYRFSSDQVASFNREQVQILNRHSPGRQVTHNFMGCFTDFDHWKLSTDLNFAAWDSYPLGLTDSVPFLGISEADRQRYALTGHPDIAAFHHDLYRGVGRGRFWVMEQQPGPVNWALWNPSPAPGMVRLWTWEAFAHGGEAVCFFRWRQAPFAQEQMHAGLNRSDNILDRGGSEVRQVAAELKTLGFSQAPALGDVALVLDYESIWIHEIQRQGVDFEPFALIYSWYGALRRLGLNIDIVPPGADLSHYPLVVLPTLPLVSPPACAALERTSAIVVVGPRTGSKTEHFQIPLNLPPGPLEGMLGLKVTRVESLRPGLAREVVWGNRRHKITKWAEQVTLTDGRRLAEFADSGPAIVANGRFVYVASWAEDDYLDEIMRFAVTKAALPARELNKDVRLRRRGHLSFMFNYGPEAVEAPARETAQFLLGSRHVRPHDLAIWRN